jgi:hypothetical protein
MAQVNGPGTPFHQVLYTTDRAYADATVAQYKEAQVPVRLDVNEAKPKKQAG